MIIFFLISLIRSQQLIDIKSDYFINTSSYSCLLESKAPFYVKWKNTHSKTFKQGFYYIDKDIHISPTSANDHMYVTLQKLPKSICQNIPKAILTADLNMMLYFDYNFNSDLIDSFCIFSQFHSVSYFIKNEHVITKGECNIQYYSQPKRSDILQLKISKTGNGTEETSFLSPFLIKFTECSGTLSFNLRYAIIRNSFNHLNCSFQLVRALNENGNEKVMTDYSHFGYCKKHNEKFITTTLFMLSIILTILLVFILFCCVSQNSIPNVL